MNERRIYSGRTGRKYSLLVLCAIGSGLLGCRAGFAAEVSEPLPASLPPKDLALARSRSTAPNRIAAYKPAAKTDPLVARLDSVIRQNILTGRKPLSIHIKPARRVGGGYFSSVAVDGSPIKVKLLEVSQLWLRAHDFRLDLPALEQGRVRLLAGQVSARLTITEVNITTLLAKQQETAGMNFKARILKDAVEITGNATSGLVRGAVRLVGVLNPQQGAVTFKVNTLTVNGSPVMPLIKMIVQGQVNSALRVDNIPFRPVFKTVRYEKGRVVVST